MNKLSDILFTPLFFHTFYFLSIPFNFHILFTIKLHFLHIRFNIYIYIYIYIMETDLYKRITIEYFRNKKEKETSRRVRNKREKCV